VLFSPSDRYLGLLVILQIWRDHFLGVSLAFVVFGNNDGGRGEVFFLEQRCSYRGGGYAVLFRLRR
jgi:hypothetical protein